MTEPSPAAITALAADLRKSVQAAAPGTTMAWRAWARELLILFGERTEDESLREMLGEVLASTTYERSAPHGYGCRVCGVEAVEPPFAILHDPDCEAERSRFLLGIPPGYRPSFAATLASRSTEGAGE